MTREPASAGSDTKATGDPEHCTTPCASEGPGIRNRARIGSSFNGAAIFRSRKPVTTATGESTVDWLQWGRDLSIAETVCFTLFRGLQCALQWGRDLSIAETVRAIYMEPGIERLQWGRDLSIAETPRRYCVHISVVSASMGPRSFDRGNHGELL